MGPPFQRRPRERWGITEEWFTQAERALASVRQTADEIEAGQYDSIEAAMAADDQRVRAALSAD